MRIKTLIIFLIIFMIGFTIGQYFKTPQKQEVCIKDVACNKYRIDYIYYKNNFKKCIDNNIKESYTNIK